MRVLVGATAVIVCMGFAGCVGPGTPKEPSERTIEIFGPYRGVEADRFRETLQPFVDDSDVEITYIGSVDFVEDLRRRVEEANDPPDVAVVPQPGLIRQLAAEGAIVPPSDDVADAVAANYTSATAELGRIDGELLGVPFRLAVKSLVWYRPDVFEMYGWMPPRTRAELYRLVTRIQAETDLAPWCFTLAAGTATGWAATDWVEDLVLRSAGPDVYRRWVAGDVRFADPVIATAFAEFRQLVLADGRVAGGIEGVVETPVDEVMEPLLGNPPGCAMAKQADFAASWLPDGTTIGPNGDIDWFVLPGVAADAPPILVGGDQIVQFRRHPDVDALIAYLAGPVAGESWARKGGFLSPKTSIPDDVYPRDYLGELVATLQKASTLAFDASDQMPPDVGSDLLWTSITQWVAGADDYETFAETVDSARAAETTAAGEPAP